MKIEIRLQKFLSSCGVASRRKSEEFIKTGKIKVNGKIITEMGFCVTNNDVIEFDGKVVKPLDKIYIVLNKPSDFVCSRQDYLKRKTIYDIVDDDKKSIFSVGRLDFKSCGLLILTNDGDFANNLSHPSNNIVKSYIVESYSAPGENLIKDFKNGIRIENETYKAVDIEKISPNILRIYLQEGKKREIREVYRNYDVKIKELKRISIGKMDLRQLKIDEGNYKYFSSDELKGLIYGK